MGRVGCPSPSIHAMGGKTTSEENVISGVSSILMAGTQAKEKGTRRCPFLEVAASWVKG